MAEKKIEQRFWVSRRDKDKNQTYVHTWKPGKDLSEAIWESQPVVLSPDCKIHLSEIPTCVAPFFAGGGHCFIGLNTGSVHRAFAPDIGENKGVFTFESRFPDYNSMRGRERDEVESDIIQGARSIFQIIHFLGNAHDVSLAGLFETENGKQIDSRRISSAVVYQGRLCIVPTHPGRKLEQQGQTYQSYRAGSLVDAITKEVVVPELTPFDGSGMKQAEYLIHDELAYVHHGNWPDERISIKELPSGRVISSFNIPTSSGFILHQGKVFDFRDGRQFGKQEGLCLVETREGVKKPIARLQEPYTSAVSAGERGIILATYDHKTDVGKLVSFLHQDKPLYECKGYLSVFSY